MNVCRGVPVRTCAALALLLAIACPVLAEVKLAAVLGSHMVLQRDLPLPIWGWADPGEKVTVTMDAATGTAQADAAGRWKVVLAPPQADGKAHRMTISGGNAIVLEDLLIGEVWLGSGQSNMAYALGKESADADVPEIRLLQIPVKLEKKPAQDTVAEWKPCTPEHAAGFASALYHFGRRLHDELKVPIGLVNSSKGSTAIEQFMPPPKSGVLYNGSIAPLQPLSIRGVLWYQGEANVMNGDGLGYGPKLKELIDGWRTAWGRDFPFYLVQLAPLKNYKTDLLPPVWEAQTAALKIPGTGMAVITDLVENLGAIHPGNKKGVGNRLALWALAKDYGRKDVVYCGPLYKAMKVEGKTIRLSFAHGDGGLKARDGNALSEFQIAGADGVFVNAQAIVDGETVVVSADSIAAPAKVRFAWHNEAVPNLVNGAGLPAAAFHTDDWTGGTAE